MSNSEHLATVMVNCFMEAVENGLDLIPVVSDSTSTAKIGPFMKKYPDRLINVGIAEQVLVGTAAGLALGGKVAATCNAAPFLVSRANEQVKVDVCYNNTNVKLFGLNSGASYGPLASTHHSIDDISIMRGFGNIEVYAPASPEQCKQIINYALYKEGPVYIRLDGKALPEIYNDDYKFVPGKIDLLADGNDIAIIGLGSVVHEIVDAKKILDAQNISAKLLCIPSIRPCNRSEIAKYLLGIPIVITVEEHNINGGIGSLVAEIIAENNLSTKLVRLGIGDGQYALAADRVSLRAYHHLDASSIAEIAVKNLNEL
ncbi:MAG: transketolase family protein [Alphaproteobacteria bacterium]